VDPVLNLSPERSQPYLWRDIEDLKKLDEKEKQFMQEASEFGLENGLAIPLFGPRGEAVYVTFGTRDKQLNINKEEQYQIQHMFYRLYNRYLELRDQKQEQRPQLTGREKEVLNWVAAGKSNSVIADILKISEHTVDTLLRRSFQKLNVSSRVAAVLKAVQHGLIVP
jgi:LuxR family transcriptional regulator/LuxR family quorum-sensing system transcriptional regulator CciR